LRRVSQVNGRDTGERRQREQTMHEYQRHAELARAKLAESEHRLEAMAKRVEEAEAKLADVERRLTESTQQAEEYKSLLQRVQADFINYKRRTEQEKSEQSKFANSMLILKLLPTLDDLERASETVRADLAGLNWVQGVLLIGRKLRAALEEEGLEKIEAQDAEFDPRLHEAVIYEGGTGGETDRVVAVLQNGYKLHDKVIRPAVVKVAGHGSVAAEDASAQ
jgi:molecular chaperone GrpE